jgi:hypothetical protein
MMLGPTQQKLVYLGAQNVKKKLVCVRVKQGPSMCIYDVTSQMTLNFKTHYYGKLKSRKRMCMSVQ